ncbi:MAG: hypothetical protein ACLGPM_11170 [Acidobacteriota bacterium]
MPGLPCMRVALGLAVCGFFLSSVAPLRAENKHTYPESGIVAQITTEDGTVYTIQTADKTYRMQCVWASLFQFTPPLCTIAGRPIAVDDTIHFRVDREGSSIARIAAPGRGEEKLLILSTELTAPPRLPASTGAGGAESCAVVGNGVERGDVQKMVQSRTSSSMPGGPVTAIPVTGGPPVLMTPTGPADGGVVTGVPVTGGAPVTAVPVAPVETGSSGPPTMVTETTWTPFLRVQTARRIFELACPSRPCWVKDRAPMLGNLLTIRVKNNKAYLAWGTAGPKGEQGFRILRAAPIAAAQTQP